MNRLFKAAVALLCAFGLNIAAHAQMTTITASRIYMSGVLIPSGTVTFTPVDNRGIPIPFSQGGGGLNSPSAFQCSITTGAITGTCQIPDAALTTPVNLLYSIQVTATATSKSFVLQNVPNITGTTWALDAYGPPAQTTNVQPIQVAYGTAAPPSSCVSPSFYVRNVGGGQLYICVAGSFVLVTGGGGGGITLPSTHAILKGDGSGGATDAIAGTDYDAAGAAAAAQTAAETAAANASNLSNGTVPAARMPAFSGDVTSAAGNTSTMLATVNTNVGACGDATHVPQVTLNGKGLTTGCTPVAITGGSGFPDPGANGFMYRTALNTYGLASVANLQTLLASDTVNNSSYGYHAGSGGDSTCPTPAASTDYFCFKGGVTNYSRNGAAYVPFVNGVAGIANTTVTLPTTAIAANTCTTAATVTMTGVATTSTFTYAFATSPIAVTGWGSTGGLVFNAWPTANTLNWSVCNQTAASITPGAMTLNVGAK